MQPRWAEEDFKSIKTLTDPKRLNGSECDLNDLTLADIWFLTWYNVQLSLQ